MARYKADNKSMAKFLRSEGLLEAIRPAALDVQSRAKRLAPAGDDYRDGIVVERDESGGAKGDRVGWNVVATGGHPTLVEWGRNDGNHGGAYEGQRVMRRAAEEVTE